MYWWRWVIALVAVAFGVYQFIHASHLGYEDVGPGNVYGAHYSRGTRGGSGTYYVHVHVNSQHQNSDNSLDGPVTVYELVVNHSSPVPVQDVEVDKFDNEVSRVDYDGRWLKITGRQTRTGLLIAGVIAMVIALVCVAWNVVYLRRGRAQPGVGLEAAT
jgi:hypothetical protein